ncbi:MAG: hypothetical protein MZV65_47470 [Chromatiales bacterium]|nr:hypothetical protein [Chromatiales bacterium]
MPARLLLHDFERIASPLPGVAMSGWTTAPGIGAGRVWYGIEPAQRPDRGRALHLRYLLRVPARPSDHRLAGITLPDLDAPALRPSRILDSRRCRRAHRLRRRA